MRLRVLVGLALLLIAAAACGGGDDNATDSPTPSPTVDLPNPAGNLLQNPGFETGADPWTSADPATGFVVSPDAAFTGTQSALLHMDDGPNATGTKGYSFQQEIAPPQCPVVIKGAYRVVNWNKGTPKQYLQITVTVVGADNSPVGDELQIRYLVAGAADLPTTIPNSRYLIFSNDDPKVGGWVGFQSKLRDDFVRVWGLVPQGFDSIRVQYEVRYDDKYEFGVHSTADVFWDDLYVGSAE